MSSKRSTADGFVRMDGEPVAGATRSRGGQAHSPRHPVRVEIRAQIEKVGDLAPEHDVQRTSGPRMRGSAGLPIQA